MSIYTRFGTPVQLIKPIDSKGWVWVRCDLGLNGTADKEVHVNDLKADYGFNEIDAASKSLMPKFVVIQGQAISITPAFKLIFTDFYNQYRSGGKYFTFAAALLSAHAVMAAGRKTSFKIIRLSDGITLVQSKVAQS